MIKEEDINFYDTGSGIRRHDIQHNDIQHNDTQYNSIMTLSIVTLNAFAECHEAVCLIG